MVSKDIGTFFHYVDFNQQISRRLRQDTYGVWIAVESKINWVGQDK